MNESIKRETKTYVQYYYTGALLAETECSCVESFNPETIFVPNGAYAFQSWKIVISTVTVEGETFTQTSEPIEKTAMYYPGGKVWSLDDLASEFGEASILYNNVKGNGYRYAVETRCGNFQFFTLGKDVILPA